MAVTIDPRPNYFGDRMVVTGSYEAGDNAIDLSSLLASIDFAGVNPSGIIASEPITDTGAGPPATQDVVLHPQTRIDGTTIRISSGLANATIADSATAQGGTFIAIGRRS
jgi:hypothetical protein